MPTFVNATPVVLDIDGQMVAPGGEVDVESSHPEVKSGHLVAAEKPASKKSDPKHEE